MAVAAGASPDPATGRAAGRDRALVLALALGQLVSWGTTFYTFPLVLGPMTAELGWDRTAAYAAPTLGLLVQAAAAPLVGRWMERRGGRLSMTLGSLALAATLLAWASVREPWHLLLAWAAMGAAQACVLYEPAFAVVAQRASLDFRRSVAAITLLGGFAGTVFVPGTQALVAALGWREAVACLALANLAVPMLLHALLVPRGNGQEAAGRGAGADAAAARAEGEGTAPALGRRVWLGLGLWFMAGAAYLSGVTFHFVPLLSAEGAAPATLAAAFAVVGPSQVAGRACLMALGHRAGAAGAGLVTVALGLVSAAMLWWLPHTPPWLVAFAVVYGAGNGIFTIARGVAVAEAAGRARYAAVAGMLQLPAGAALALAPVALSALGDAGGPGAIHAALFGFAALGALGFALAVPGRGRT